MTIDEIIEIEENINRDLSSIKEPGPSDNFDQASHDIGVYTGFNKGYSLGFNRGKEVGENVISQAEIRGYEIRLEASLKAGQVYGILEALVVGAIVYGVIKAVKKLKRKTGLPKTS